MLNCNTEKHFECMDEKVIEDVGNQSVVKIEEPFRVDACYCFQVSDRNRQMEI